ncbi:MAG: hypothetical protein FJX77_18035, partial [Armatimonadetes bacterium]|nr:hypothetical protein [Armatimonadota bacterium]
ISGLLGSRPGEEDIHYTNECVQAIEAVGLRVLEEAAASAYAGPSFRVGWQAPSNARWEALWHLAASSWIAEIRPFVPPRIATVRAVAMVVSGPHDGEGVEDGHERLSAAKLDGSGELIAVTDTGADLLHSDLQPVSVRWHSLPVGQVLSAHVHGTLPQPESHDRGGGHGTKVLGAIAARSAGIARGVQVLLQAAEHLCDWKHPIPNNLRPVKRIVPLAGLPHVPSSLCQAAYEQGARVHNMSWEKPGVWCYGDLAHDVDRFVWEHPHYLLVTVAGNYDPSYQNSDIWDMALARNGIAVGAIERTSTGWELAPYSRRGNANLNWIKPDLVAPGSQSLVQTSHGLRASRTAALGTHAQDQGTSFAAPLVAGAAALVRQYVRRYSTKEGGDGPSAALVKCILISAAVPIEPRPAGCPPRDRSQGWGCLNLSLLVAPDPSLRLAWWDVRQPWAETSALGETEIWETALTTQTADSDLRCTLAACRRKGGGARIAAGGQYNPPGNAPRPG